MQTYHYELDRIVVNNKYSARLLVDCTGKYSSIKYKENLVEFEVNLNCYGAYLEYPQAQKNYNYYNTYQTNDKDNFEMVGITKLSSRKIFFLYFRYSLSPMDVQFYHKKFRYYLKHLGYDHGKITEKKVFTYS
ncbi:MAG: hypothetical protein QW594_02140, partial [Candidatus Woesearchaeota archaeon]